MERCDFASITSIILNHINHGMEYTQTEFINDLFLSAFLKINSSSFKLDKASVSRWLSGTTKVSTEITKYYQTDRTQKEMTEDIMDTILPRVNDPGLMIRELYDLVAQDIDISDESKELLCKGAPWEMPEEKAEFMKSLIIHGINCRFIKRDSRSNALLASDSLSPSVRNYIFDEGTPLPCRYFCGREHELTILHNLLIESGKVFVHGIPGIGKSEIAKKYAKKYKKYYTNVLFISYSGSLKADITELPFADDHSTDTAKDRFRKHNRFLRTLKEDSLIIIDNYNALPDEDDFLHVILNYRCRILFTTRCSYLEYSNLEIREIEDKETLFHLVSCFYTGAEKVRPTIEKILEVIHWHTMCTELVARLLKKGFLLPDEVLERLQKEHTSFSASDKVSLSKDGKSTRKTYYDHLRTLFGLFQLSTLQMDVMRNLSLVPLTGIPARLFGKWMNYENLNDLNNLIEMGLVKELNEFNIALHPLIREEVISSLSPGITNCRILLKSIQRECLQHGLFLPYHTLMFHIIENTISMAIKDSDVFYLQFLQDVFPYMDTYSYSIGMQQIITEMEKASKKNTPLAKDQALLLLYKSRMETNIKTSITYLHEALELFPEANVNNAALIANLHSTLGDLYRESRDYGRAEHHMEAAAIIFRQFGLDGTHDCVTLYINFSTLYLDAGSPMTGLQYLLKIDRLLMEREIYSVDYMTVQEDLIYVYLSLNNLQEAQRRYIKLMELYDIFYEKDPDTLADKKAAIETAFTQHRTLIQRKTSK